MNKSYRPGLSSATPADCVEEGGRLRGFAESGSATSWDTGAAGTAGWFRDIALRIMDFRIADTFVDSLARLTGEEQKAAKVTALDLQLDPVNPGMQLHRLDRAKDKNFWSARAGRDLRIILHRTSASLLLCYVDHHDKAYAWAERRKIETHPVTRAAQIVEIREVVREMPVTALPDRAADEGVRVRTSAVRPFVARTESELLGYGVPVEWIEEVRKADEDSILEVATHLPAEAAEALLEIAVGRNPIVAVRSMPPSPDIGSTSTPLRVESHSLERRVVPELEAPETGRGEDPFEHPDARRRFMLVQGPEELRLALDFPWDRWTVFLHPDQRQWVERDFSGPARVSGSAGTGKTVVALHRAVFLARTNSDSRVLLTTFTDPLASTLRTKLKRLLGNEPRLGERVDVEALDAVGARLYRAQSGPLALASPEQVRQLLKEHAAAVPGHGFGARFLQEEWGQVVDAWQVTDWDAYRNVARLGRKTRLPEARRKVLWTIFERVRASLAERGLVTRASMFARLASALESGARTPYEHVVIDEAQDLSVPQLRFLAALGASRPNGLFFAGDTGQRIFQQPFSWRTLGVDIRGRARTLRVNYRTSHQIRGRADRLLGPDIADADGNVENRSGTVSVFNGPEPTVRTFRSEADEVAAVANWIEARRTEGVLPHEFGVFIRAAEQMDRAREALKAAGLAFKVLDDRVETTTGCGSLGTMHLAKGLEFRAVVVMACDDEVIPSQVRIDEVGDEADLKDVYDTERQLLYVACTRARDFLLVTGVEPASEFLDDLSATRAA